MKTTVISGIRATGRLHLGNYFGAMQNFVSYQSLPDHTCLYFIADFHTLTTLKEPQDLRGNLLNIAMDYLAAGLDPNLSTIYVQSSVPEFAELALYLSMIQKQQQLEDLPTLQDLKGDSEDMTLGKLAYPVLMAADILGTRANLVPVGKDQVPNVELTRDIAKIFNRRFGETFRIPRTMENMVKVPGLTGKKMGKSTASEAVDISMAFPKIRELYMRKAITDPKRTHRDIAGNPDECVAVYPMHLILDPSEKESKEIDRLCRSAEIGCRDCKTKLVDRLETFIGPFQEARRKLEEKGDEVCEILHEGGKSVRKIVQAVTAEVRDKMGIKVY